METKISKRWFRDNSQPEQCDSCNEEDVCNMGFVKIGKVKIYIWLCDNCLEKLKKEVSNSSHA